MGLKNTETEYGWLAKIFHWVIGIAMVAMVFLGWYMSDLEASPDKYALYGLHKSIGVAVLAFFFVRFGWRLYSGVPKAIETHKPWERFLSHTLHYVLYGLILALPLSGWMMSSSAGYPVSFFGLFELPAIVEKNKELSKFMNTAHSLLGWGVHGFTLLHVVGALKHHLFDKDNTLKRMLFFCKNK